MGSSSDAGVAAMRVSDGQMRHSVLEIARCAIAAIILCGVAAPAMADELLQALPNSWLSATALSLTLVTAASRPKK
jgi:hypothetical protein